eukprot:TRINITY_DN308_c0_g1_i1.p1 TRINITY_DN308_c0_g1~~TRINITY_DN308_c0_g1_i1.p1  ORF type:complete len:374 (-),score=79.43 TRINITY_DN308_c0_g1_i1:180-1301(-)
MKINSIFVLFICVLTVSSYDEVEEDPLPDYYAVLKVSPKASLKEIKKTFRRLAMQLHPDKNKEESAQEQFKELSEAYSVLSDSEKRRDYDELYYAEIINTVHEDDVDIPEEFDTDSKEAEEGSPASEDPEAEEDSNIDEVDEDDSELEEEEVDPEDNEADEEERSKFEDLHSIPKEKDSAWGDLDDESLYKVLRFLAENDYEITKKKTYKEDIKMRHRFEEDIHSRGERSPNSDFVRNERASFRSSEPRYTTPHDRHRFQHQGTGHRAHDQTQYHGHHRPHQHQYRAHHDHARREFAHTGHDQYRSTHRATHHQYNGQFSQHGHRGSYQHSGQTVYRSGKPTHDKARMSSGSQYCTITVRYDGNTKVTVKSCR